MAANLTTQSYGLHARAALAHRDAELARDAREREQAAQAWETEQGILRRLLRDVLGQDVGLEEIEPLVMDGRRFPCWIDDDGCTWATKPPEHGLTEYLLWRLIDCSVCERPRLVYVGSLADLGAMDGQPPRCFNCRLPQGRQP